MSFTEMLAFLGEGIWTTLILIPIGMVTTFVIGLIVGVVRFRNYPVVSQIIDVYILIMRGLPPLIVLSLIFATLLVGSPMFMAILGLTIYHSAYVAEIVRGALAEVPSGQRQAGESLGFGFWFIMRRIYLPQVLLQITPALAGQYIMLVKDTTLVSVVGLQDVMWFAQQLMAYTNDPISAYLIIGVIFYLICFAMELLGAQAERFLSRHNTRVRIA